jgi:hypothetical protein
MSIRYGYALAAMLALSVLPHPSEPERQLHSSHRSCLHDGAENRGVKMNLSASDTAQKTDRQRSEPRIAVRPVPPPTDGQTGLLAFEAAAPWMTGWIRLRMPETLASSQGLHFIDHQRSDMPPLASLSPFPQWKTDRRTGALSYTAKTREGVKMRATVRPGTDQVDLEFAVTNETGKPLNNLNCQMCLVLTEEPQFGRRLDLNPVHTWVEGRFTSFGATTPTPEQKKREPWVLMLTQAGAKVYGGAREWPDGWWVVDQLADFPAIARVSADGRRLLAIHWGPQQLMLMTNTRIPCLHAGPTQSANIAPGATHVWKGAILFLDNDPEALRQRLKAARVAP